MPSKPASKPSNLTSIVAVVVIVIAAAGTLCVLALADALDSGNAPAWVTAISTASLVIVAGVALWPAARQVREAARASAQSHRPYVSLGTRVSVEGFLYLDLVNHGNRAALDVAAMLSHAPLENVQNTEMPEAPFGLVTYLAPNERRSIIYASVHSADECPSELKIETAYTGEDGTKHRAIVTHDLDALKLILTNPENRKTPQQLLQDGLRGIGSVIDGAIRQVTDANAPSKRRRLRSVLERLKATGGS